MQKVYVVRVGNRYLNSLVTVQKHLLTASLTMAMRCTFDEALEWSEFAASAFPTKTRVFIAHQDRPNEEIDPDNPREFVITIGRRYLGSLNGGTIRTSFFLKDAARYTKGRAIRMARKLRSIMGETPVDVASEATPFLSLAIVEESDEVNDEADDDAND